MVITTLPLKKTLLLKEKTLSFMRKPQLKRMKVGAGQVNEIGRAASPKSVPISFIFNIVCRVSANNV